MRGKKEIEGNRTEKGESIEEVSKNWAVKQDKGGQRDAVDHGSGAQRGLRGGGVRSKRPGVAEDEKAGGEGRAARGRGKEFIHRVSVSSPEGH